jgi:hypothetical protein
LAVTVDRAQRIAKAKEQLRVVSLSEEILNRVLNDVLEREARPVAVLTPKAASLRNLRPWKPGQSGNPNGRPRAPRFAERLKHAILTALAGVFWRGYPADRDQRNAGRVGQTRTVLKALELFARLNGEPTRRTGCRLSRDLDLRVAVCDPGSTQSGRRVLPRQFSPATRSGSRIELSILTADEAYVFRKEEYRARRA